MCPRDAQYGIRTLRAACRRPGTPELAQGFDIGVELPVPADGLQDVRRIPCLELHHRQERVEPVHQVDVRDVALSTAVPRTALIRRTNSARERAVPNGSPRVCPLRSSARNICTRRMPSSRS